MIVSASPDGRVTARIPGRRGAPGSAPWLAHDALGHGRLAVLGDGAERAPGPGVLHEGEEAADERKRDQEDQRPADRHIGAEDLPDAHHHRWHAALLLAE